MCNLTEQISSAKMESVYAPCLVEEKWYNNWLENGYFHATSHAKVNGIPKEPFCIVIPPPNITGSLHMGHALDNTIQDLFIRWKKMQGNNAMWLPGTDHAGIATQMVVEKFLQKEGLSRHKLGREEFLKRVWAWKKEYGNIIIEQLKKLGCSCDWSRERFTMDEGYSNAIRKAFVHLYNKGFIYRDYYIINWCPRCQTAISDLEVEHEDDANGKLYYVLYPLACSAACYEGERSIGGLETASDEGIVIATTRPETILADVAIAVNPKDPRYKDLIGKTIIVPVVNRPIPVIADDIVDPDFGTGALKITPGHDLNDFQVGKRHNLTPLIVIDLHGKMNQNAEKFSSGKVPEGTDRFVARKIMEEVLAEGGCLIKAPEPYLLPLAHCARCNTILEPAYSIQWFMRMNELAKPAIQVVKDGKIKFTPERFTGIYLNWMENIRDWCISRQLWWGHRIPAWFCQKCRGSQPIVSDTPPSVCPSCNSKDLLQDEDVLDTWFSSALWPFATMGWPEKTPELTYFYPTSILVTGRDILFLWVARMIMMGLEFIRDIPFKEVYIHATILDKEGRRMSKSKGTGVDPLDLISKYGADATRFGTLIQTAQGQDIRFSHEKIEMARNFGNKIWNATRLILKLVDKKPDKPDAALDKWPLTELWIYKKVKDLVFNLTLYGRGELGTQGGSLERYAFSDVCRLLYEFFWFEFCDWYLELAKFILSGPEQEIKSGKDENRKSITRWLLWEILTTFIKLSHPIMPFITEEIWHILNPGKKTIMEEDYPDFIDEDMKVDKTAEDSDVFKKMQFLRDVVWGIRNLRQELNINPKTSVSIWFQTEDGMEIEVLSNYMSEIKFLAQVKEILQAKEPAGETLKATKNAVQTLKKALTARVGKTSLFLPLEGLIDIGLEIERLKKELERTNKLLDDFSLKLTPEFLKKAKPEVKAREESKLKELMDKQTQLLSRLELLR